ncbi:MAG: T9SS type A sorting domain-containing protein [Dinghuibacter sp.]|nr:T9SS type A sorting domain-containing protein [Dinghuibacter sp.]
MKKLIFYIIPLFFSAVLQGQTYSNTSVLTPRASSVQALSLTSADYTSAQKASIKANTLATYPGVTFLADATLTYNCHGYAWHISEGGTPNVWINAGTNNLSKYWTDGSYVQVCTEAAADKIHYFSGDHSAIKSAVAGKYESKWGSDIRVRHNPTEVPSIYISGSRNYYATTKINGSTAALCSGTRTFSVKAISGATYSWTFSSNLVAVGATNASSLTVQKASATGGSAWVTVQISTGCGSATRSVGFSLGGQLPITMTSQGCGGGGYQYWLLSVPAVGSNYNWSVGVLGTNSQITIANPSSSSTQVSVKGGGTVSVSYIDACGVARTDGITVYSTCPAFRLNVSASPNPAKGIVNLALEQEGETAKSGKGFTQVKLFDLKTNLQVKQWTYYENTRTSYSLNVAGLQTGLYLLKAERNGETASVKLMID